MKQAGPIPKTIELAKTVAQRVRQLRDLRNLTVRDLARGTKFGIRRLEDIESGLETWFSSTDRQILAKALVVEPALIEEVEVRNDNYANISNYLGDVPEAVNRDLSQAILKGVGPLSCPLCGHRLQCSIQNGFDIDGHPVKLAKANCSKCPFILRV